MGDKKLSIIIPHYNSCSLVKKLIDSIPEREEIQVILVDDNSTEDTADLQEYIKKRQIEFYRNDSDTHSAGRCRNIGLQHAEGEWLLFADADDFFLEGFYNIISPYFDKEYDIVYFASTSINLKDGKVSNRHMSICNLIHNYAAAPTKENEVQLRYEYVGPIAKLVRGSMVRQKQISFDELRVANDVMFSVECAANAQKIAVNETVIYCITKSEGSLITSIKREDVRTRFKVAVKKYKYLRSHVDRETWIMLDLRGDRYTKMFKKYKMGTGEKIWAWCYMLINGVRPCVSRKVNMRNVIPKIAGRIFKKSGT